MSRRDVLRVGAASPFFLSALLSGQLEASEVQLENAQKIVHMMLTQMNGVHTIKRPKGAVECTVGSTTLSIVLDSSGRCSELEIGKQKVQFDSGFELAQFSKAVPNSLAAVRAIERSRLKPTALHARDLSQFEFDISGTRYVAMPGYVYEVKGQSGEVRELLRLDGVSIREEQSDDGSILLTQALSSGGKLEDRWVNNCHQRTRIYGSDGAVQTSDLYSYHHSGERFSTTHYRFDNGNNVPVWQDTFYKGGKKKSRYTIEDDQLLAYGLDGSLVCRVEHFGDGQKRLAVILDEKEREILRVFQGDSIHDAEKYIRQMPEVFFRNGKWDLDRYSAFLDYFMLYQTEQVSDYFKFGSLCLLSQKDGCISGDCDNYAFISRDMMRYGGENAHCLSIRVDQGNKWHLVCVLVKKKRGKYHAYSLCNFNISHNGVIHGMDETPTSLKGYDTEEEAILSLLPQFAHWNDILACNWHVTLVDAKTYEVLGNSDNYYSDDQPFSTLTITKSTAKLSRDSF